MPARVHANARQRLRVLIHVLVRDRGFGFGRTIHARRHPFNHFFLTTGLLYMFFVAQAALRLDIALPGLVSTAEGVSATRVREVQDRFRGLFNNDLVVCFFAVQWSCSSIGAMSINHIFRDPRCARYFKFNLFPNNARMGKGVTKTGSARCSSSLGVRGWVCGYGGVGLWELGTSSERGGSGHLAAALAQYCNAGPPRRPCSALPAPAWGAWCVACAVSSDRGPRRRRPALRVGSVGKGRFCLCIVRPGSVGLGCDSGDL